eukprot:119344-Prymnesium_polylepis.1
MLFSNVSCQRTRSGAQRTRSGAAKNEEPKGEMLFSNVSSNVKEVEHRTTPPLTRLTSPPTA